jgi:hypothetical protein
MLNRLGLVIHWLGLIFSAALLFGATTVALEGNGLSMPVLDATLYICGPIVGGWLFRFITTSHKSPLPWVANKEANNER